MEEKGIDTGTEEFKIFDSQGQSCHQLQRNQDARVRARCYPIFLAKETVC